ncbi:MAG TPA: DEAD/DEAH box helicase [Nocardioidaceae bacterium]|nr:DEAD/DEAH box helicase [Nocardioidaceae bacterium]
MTQPSAARALQSAAQIVSTECRSGRAALRAVLRDSRVVLGQAGICPSPGRDLLEVNPQAEIVTSSSPMATASQLAAYFQLAADLRVAEGRIHLCRWTMDPSVPGFVDTVARRLGEAYVSPMQRLQHPDWPLKPRLPSAEGTTRKGDLGEVLAATLFSRRMGRTVPFEKVASKPVAGATQHGPDILALTLEHGDPPVPVVVEVKTRPKISPKKDLVTIQSSLASVDDDYLLSAWMAAVGLMESHPEFEKQYALSAAQHLAQLVSRGGEFPPHERQAVIITDVNTLSVQKVEEHWGHAPPVTTLHIIELGDIEKAIDNAYTAAEKLSYSDLASNAPPSRSGGAMIPGVSAPVSSTEAKRAVRLSRNNSRDGAIEAALWQLADWDGMAHARAIAAQDAAATPVDRGLAELLTGALGAARKNFEGHEPLVHLAQALTEAWNRTRTPASIPALVDEIVGELHDPQLEMALRYVAAGNIHRLTRHPVSLVEAAGARGPNVAHIVQRMQQLRQAFWPSQARAIEAGLLDRSRPSLVVKMPTSAGKTKLIELLAADTLDADEDASVIVLAPTNALVGQLTRSLRGGLPSVSVRSSHGGFDLDIDDPEELGAITHPGVAVMTPERFDLEWRRVSTAGDSDLLENVKVLIADEAHLLDERRRGPGLELIVARALRRGIRVALMSSQFPDPSVLGAWLGGQAVESSWSPAWLQRFVYFRSDDQKTGYLQAENGAPVAVFQLKPTPPPGSSLVVRSRAAEAAALAIRQATDGLVLVFSDQRRYVDQLATAVTAAFDDGSASSVPTELLDRAARVAPECVAALQRGVGIHHGQVPADMRRIVEVAARRNLLRCVVCTPTLLEGVDLPVRTVIAAYPPESYGKPQIARLRNLAGRAGRGGRFASGRLVVATPNQTKARAWFRAFRTELPPTRSALTSALQHLHALADTLELVDPTTNDETLAAADALILAALVEGAIADGDLQTELEQLLGQTLWAVGADASRRNALLTVAATRAKRVQAVFGADRWQRAFYRTALPLGSCVALRDAIRPMAPALAVDLGSSQFKADEWLLQLACNVAPAAEVLSHWRDVDPADLREVLAQWLAGIPVADIDGAYPDTWQTVQFDLDKLIPWVLTSVIEFLAAELNSDAVKEQLHRRLEVFRLRYGVPRRDLCELVRRGCDRVRVVELAHEHAQLPEWDQFSEEVKDFVLRRLAEEEEALLMEEDENAADGVTEG